MKNYYIEHIAEIAEIAYEEKVDWSVALAKWNHKHPTLLTDEAGELMREFLAHVTGKTFDEHGNLTGYIWQDGSVHDAPEKDGE